MKPLKTKQIQYQKELLNYDLTKYVSKTIQHTQIRAWSVYHPLEDRVITYLFCPIPTMKKQMQSKTFQTLKDVQTYLSSYELVIPTDILLITRLCFPTFSDHSFTVIYEPMLNINSMYIFLSRLKTITNKDITEFKRSFR